MTEAIGGPLPIESQQEFAWLQQTVRDVIPIVERALAQEAKGQQPDLEGLYRDIKRALLPHDAEQAGEPAAASFSAAHAHSAGRPRQNNYPCRMRGPGRDRPLTCQTIKAYTPAGAWAKCRDRAAKKNQDPVSGVPKPGRCP
jgi:hypothetical protein